jgi:hypothetical protein
MAHTMIDDLAKTFRLRPHSAPAFESSVASGRNERPADENTDGSCALSLMAGLSLIGRLIAVGALIGLSGLV